MSVDTSNSMNEMLLTACETGNLAEVQRLVSLGADVNYQNLPLQNAIKSGNPLVVQLLLKKDIDISTAAESLYMVFSNLMQENAETTDTPESAENKATKEDTSKKALEMFSAFYDTITFKMLSPTLLLTAYLQKKKNLLEILLDQNINLYDKTEYAGKTVIEGIKKEKNELIDVIIKKCKEKQEGAALELEKFKTGNIEEVKKIKEAAVAGDLKPFLEALLSQQFDLLENLINSGFDLEQVFKDGETALFKSLKESNGTAIQFLLSKKVKIDPKTQNYIENNISDSETIMHLRTIAADANHDELQEIVRKVMLARTEKKSKEDENDPNMRFAHFIHALKQNDMETVKKLETGINLNQQYKLGTAIVEAARANNEKAVKYLLEKGANPVLTSLPNLVTSKENPNETTNAGLTALETARRFNAVSVIPLLRDAEEAVKNNPQHPYHKYLNFITYRDNVVKSGHILGLAHVLPIWHPDGYFVNVNSEGSTGYLSSKWGLECSRKFLNAFDNNSPAHPHFQRINQALELTHDFAARDRKVNSEVLHQSFTEGKAVLTPLSFGDHAISVTFYKDHLVLCNRGLGMINTGLSIYKISNLNSITPNFIEKMSNAKSMEEVKELLKSIQIDSAHPEVDLPIKDQRHGTCSFVNIQKSPIFALLYLYKLEEPNTNHETALHYAQKNYKHYTKVMRDNHVDDMIAEYQTAYKQGDLPAKDLWIHLMSQSIIAHHGQDKKESYDRLQKKDQEVTRTLKLWNSIQDPADKNKLIETLKESKVYWSVIRSLSQSRSQNSSQNNLFSEEYKLAYEAALNGKNDELLKMLLTTTTPDEQAHTIQRLKINRVFWQTVENLDLWGDFWDEYRQDREQALAGNHDDMMHFLLTKSKDRFTLTLTAFQQDFINDNGRLRRDLEALKEERNALFINYIKSDSPNVDKLRMFKIYSDFDSAVKKMIDDNDVLALSRCFQHQVFQPSISYGLRFKFDDNFFAYMIQNNRFDCLKVFLNNGVDQFKQYSSDGFNLLTQMANENNIEFIKKCLDNNIDIDDPKYADMSSRTPYSIAKDNNNTEMVQMIEAFRLRKNLLQQEVQQQSQQQEKQQATPTPALDRPRSQEALTFGYGQTKETKIRSDQQPIRPVTSSKPT